MHNDDDDAAVDDEDWLDIPVADKEEEENQQQEDVTLSGTMLDGNTENAECLAVEQGSIITYCGRAGGLTLSSCWEHLNKQQHPDSSESIQSRCRSCNCMVKHHKKSERVISHLNKCKQFRRSMADIASSDLPSWFITAGRGNKRRASYAASASSSSSSPPLRRTA